MRRANVGGKVHNWNNSRSKLTSKGKAFFSSAKHKLVKLNPNGGLFIPANVV